MPPLMLDPSTSPLRRRGLALALVSLCAGLAWAQVEDEPPRGFELGRWALAPYFETSYEADDNIFRRVDLPNEPFIGPVSDELTTVTGGFDLRRPIRNSLFEMSYAASRLEYTKNRFARDLTHDFSADFVLNLSSMDHVKLTEEYSLGISDLQRVDQGGELVFDGEPYRYNSLTLEADRSEPLQPGYYVRLSRIDFNYEERQASLGFFDYRGWDTAVEYRQPLPTSKWLIGYYNRRRFDHYRASEAVGTPFRRELSDTLQVGLRGYVGARQSFFLRAGFNRFRYDLLNSTDFTGLVFHAQWNPALGESSKFRFSLTRRPLPSSFDTYYIINELRGQFDHEWAPDMRVGARAVFSVNRYGGPIVLVSGSIDCSTFVREDQRYDVEGYVDLVFQQHYGLRLSATRQQRLSNCDLSEYTANIVSAGFRVGWY